MDNGNDSDSRTATAIVGYTVPMTVLVLSTVLRIYAKLSQDRVQADDFYIVFATVLAIAYSIVVLASLRNGFGKHTSSLSLRDREAFLKAEYISSNLYNVSLAATKLGILALYYRIFPIRWFSRTVIACGVFICLWIVTIEVFMALLCRPIQAFWDVAVEGHCFNSTSLTYYVNASNMITDLVLFALPIPVILGVRTTNNKKVALVAVFSIGFITCGISAARLGEVVAIGSSDITWEGVPLGILSAFESLGGVLCANLPIIYRLFRTVVQKISSSVSGTKTTHVQYGHGSIHQAKAHTRTRGQSEVEGERWIRLPNGNSSGENHTSSDGLIQNKNNTTDPETLEMGTMHNSVPRDQPDK
ncbi:hypothetical protein BDV25DRAFT_22028 [Aspergillus avenaceus]|uniref:Rhodopsin domain-containing protein n=1 Tax=Aspergillus avenaceus TaxID=36643 RepID=A0A5N6U4S1_ASPAV|nr:hypothetical protein BDV25DRAFT_22028 [Aspergillus avenaceus]